ncbi:MAG: hypothetical protein L6R39_006023 [Caloplaca ligustica]|nr:MAG: hypothetical protein L6R39_006023 [Caloplaca ligustica]
MCEINISTKGGGNCHADVTCSDEKKRDYDNWDNCAYQAVNNFTDEAIGPFSIVFTKKDHDCDDGLCAPSLALADVGDYYALDVQALSNDAQKRANKATLCKVGCSPSDPFTNPDSKNICESTNGWGDSTKRGYKCGMPKIGQNYGPGKLDSQGPTNDRGYAPGSCGVHVTQYQKKDPAADPKTNEDGDYHLDVRIFDNNQDLIGEVKGARALAGQAVNEDSKLPWVLLVTAQSVDSDPVLFAYSDQHWAYADVAHNCNFGKFSGGDRDGDCGFQC